MTPEQREDREAELRHEIAREWIRLAITEGIVVWLPFGVFVALYLAGALSERDLAIGGFVAGGVMVALVLYWVLVRIRPKVDALGRLGAS